MIISEKIYWILSYLAVALTAGMILFHWNELPDQVAMHFNAQGVVDRYGDKSELFLLPVISLILIILFKWMASKLMKINPHKYGAKNEEQLQVTKSFTAQMALFTTLILGYATYISMAVSVGKREGLGSSFLWILILGFVLLLGHYFWELSKTPKS